MNERVKGLTHTYGRGERFEGNEHEFHGFSAPTPKSMKATSLSSKQLAAIKAKYMSGHSGGHLGHTAMHMAKTPGRIASQNQSGAAGSIVKKVLAAGAHVAVTASGGGTVTGTLHSGHKR